MTAVDAPPKRPRRALRIALVALLGLVALPVLIVALVSTALRLRPVQQSLLSRLSTAIEEKTGGTVSVDGLDLALSTGTVRLKGVTYGVRGGPPLATAKSVVVTIDPSSLRSSPVVRLVDIDGLTLDLDAPFPEAPGKTGDEPPSLQLPVELERIDVRGISVRRTRIPATLAPYLTALEGEGARLTGSYHRAAGGRGELTLDVPELRLVGRAPYPSRTVVAKLTASTGGAAGLELVLTTSTPGLQGKATLVTRLTKPSPLDGKVTLETELAPLLAGIPIDALPAPARDALRRLEPAGRGTVDVALSGTLDQPVAAFRVETAGLAFLLPPAAGRTAPATRLALTKGTLAGRASRAEVVVDELALALEPEGSLLASGRWDVTSGDVRARLEGSALPADLLETFAGERPFRLAGARGTTLDATLDAQVPKQGDPTGTAELRWSRGATALAHATATLQAGKAGGVAVPFEVVLLDDAPGVRRATGTITAATPADLAQGSLLKTRVTLDAPDLPDLLARLRALWPELLSGVPGELPLAGSLTATATVDGPLRSPRVVLEGRSVPGPGELLTLAGSGRPLGRSGEITLTGESLLLTRYRPSLAGRGSLRLHVAGSPSSFRGDVTASARDLVVAPDTPTIATASLAATFDERELRLERLEATLAAVAGSAERPGSPERTLSASGRLDHRRPTRDAELVVAAREPATGRSVELPLTVRDGVLELRGGRVVAYDTELALTGELPLGALRRRAELREKLSFLPGDLPDGVLSLQAFAPLIDSQALATLDPEGSSHRRARACGPLVLNADVDLADPAGGSLVLQMPTLFLDSGVASLVATTPLELRLADRTLTLLPLDLAGEHASLSLEGRADLSGLDVRGDVALADIVRDVSGSALGTLDGSFLNPFLAGGIASGTLGIVASVSGAPSDLTGSILLDGPNAALFWPQPYASKLQAPRLALQLAGGDVRITEGHALLNGGSVDLSGGYTARGLALDVAAQDVRYRLAYGLLATFGGRLSLVLPRDETSPKTLSGRLTMDRGLLDRDVDLDREILNRFFAPPESSGTEDSILAHIGLDLVIDTATGVRVKNNLADLRAIWSSLAIGGTMQEPIPKGRIDVEPGGLVFVYQQTFRLDRCTLTYTGDPTTDPRIEASTTSSLTDPSIARAEGAPASFDSKQKTDDEDQKVQAGQAIAYGLAGYYGERVASRLGSSLGVTIRPVLIFSEADPGARLTVSRDFSRNVSFTFSLDLTKAQAQTYLLDLHGWKGLPTLTVQGFTNDDGRWGGTLQQSLELRGPRHLRTSGHALGVVTASAGDRKLDRRLRASVTAKKGDPIPESFAFDSEVAAEQALREAGYPDARVTATLGESPTKKGRLDLSLVAVPGARTEIVFEGDVPPRPSRAAIAALYRGDFFEAQALEEMKRKTIKVFRSLSHLDPRVTITSERPNDQGVRRVVVRTEAGPAVDLSRLRFAGVDAETEALLAARFRGPLERTELLAGEKDADRRIRAALRSLGYPLAEVVGTGLEGGTLLVTLSPGPRSVLSGVTIVGLGDDDRRRLLATLGVAAGDPARSDALARGAQVLTRDLESRGFVDVSVRTVVSPTSPEDPPPLAVRYEVDPGLSYRIAGVRYEGLVSSSRSLLDRLAHLTPGSLLLGEDLDAARYRLAGLGTFSGVKAETEKRADGTADVVFSLEEKPRFTLSYGVRYENQVGFGAVVDLVDHNFLGRAITVGLRGLYEPGDQAGRVFFGAKEVLGSKVSIDVFAEGRRQRDPDSNTGTDTLETTLQLSRPLSPRLGLRVYGRYRRDHIFEIDPDPFFPFDLTFSHPYVGTQLVYDSRADAVLGTKGVLASLDLSGSGSFLGSDASYVRLYGQLNVYRPLFSILGKSVTWAQSVRVGLARPFLDQPLIRSARFFAGGEYSIRGYEKDNVGPREDLGGELFPSGGEALLVLNEELRVPVHPKLMGVLFFDLGNVWETTSDFGGGFAKSLGLGVRALTPVGILRFDAARPLDRREGDPSFKVYFGFGNAF